MRDSYQNGSVIMSELLILLIIIFGIIYAVFRIKNPAKKALLLSGRATSFLGAILAIFVIIIHLIGINHQYRFPQPSFYMLPPLPEKPFNLSAILRLAISEDYWVITITSVTLLFAFSAVAIITHRLVKKSKVNKPSSTKPTK